MLHYRIRWAKSDYNETEGKWGRYFNIPADQLIEYPGYVYHCHILPHEDNEMMRPIMLQLPSDYQLNPSIPCTYDEDKKPLLKWKDRYECINKLCQDKWLPLNIGYSSIINLIIIVYLHGKKEKWGLLEEVIYWW